MSVNHTRIYAHTHTHTHTKRSAATKASGFEVSQSVPGQLWWWGADEGGDRWGVGVSREGSCSHQYAMVRKTSAPQEIQHSIPF